jgi:hypothetical protein
MKERKFILSGKISREILDKKTNVDLCNLEVIMSMALILKIASLILSVY